MAIAHGMNIGHLQHATNVSNKKTPSKRCLLHVVTFESTAAVSRAIFGCIGINTVSIALFSSIVSSFIDNIVSENMSKNLCQTDAIVIILVNLYVVMLGRFRIGCFAVSFSLDIFILVCFWHFKLTFDGRSMADNVSVTYLSLQNSIKIVKMKKNKNNYSQNE